MPSTLTLGGIDGKRLEKIERNTRWWVFCEILLLWMAVFVGFFARGFSGAQSVISAVTNASRAILKVSTGRSR
jgi:hypothetical protein